MGVWRTIFHYATLGIVDSNEEVIRKNTPFKFPYNLTEAEFKQIATSVAKPIKRLVKVTIKDQFVHGTVRTQSGINTWKFTIDFNDYGTLTGKYWIRHNENIEAQIPYSYAKQLKSAIVNHLKSV